MYVCVSKYFIYTILYFTSIVCPNFKSKARRNTMVKNDNNIVSHAFSHCKCLSIVALFIFEFYNSIIDI